MNVEDAIRILDDSSEADAWLFDLRFLDLVRAKTNLDSIARSGITVDQFSCLIQQLMDCVGDISDPDMALNNLERFLAAARNPISMGALFERDPTALPILLRIFSASQFLSDLIVRDTESYDSLRLTEGQLYSRELLLEELIDEVSRATESIQAMQILRRFKHRETLRIAFGDLIVGHRLEQTVEQISFLADSIIDAARHFAWQELTKKMGRPMVADGGVCRYVVLALGKLGGSELNYSSDIDLIAIYESDGQTEVGGKSNQEFFQRLTRDMIKLLNESTSLGAAYRVDMRLRPEGSRGPVCSKSSAFLRYYDLQGRTWERQALIKARPVAGDLGFGNELLRKLEPWVYRPILNRVDIQEIKSLKRQIENRATVSGEERTNVKTGYGGIRDIEFTIQFLQLLHGGNLSSVRSGNTIDAIRLLADAGCLNRQESELLTQNYCWLRKLEHLLQIMFDLQTHTLPEEELEASKIALRMGYKDCFGVTALKQFRNDLKEITEVNNRMLNHLLHSAFGGQETAESDGGQEQHAVDLILQPEVSDESAAEILQPYGFVDPKSAARNIESLARESTLFLSSRRSRHFLAAIINELLARIAETPDPDATLVSLSSIADAIGGKAALWELLSFNAPSLEMFVRLCACSDYLGAIVRRNPGMIDELIDSLLMDRLPAIDWLRNTLDELTTGATDKQFIIHSFKQVQHLRVGIRDIVARDPVKETHRALSDIAEVCLQKIAAVEFAKCAAKYSHLAMQDEDIADRNSLVVVTMGKLGGREPNYHSDLDVLYLYDSEESKNAWIETSPQHFYSELAAKITKAISLAGPAGKLYDIDCRLRPNGKSGALAVSFNEFERYFETGQGQVWERQALCKARTVFGSSELHERASLLIRKAITGIPWESEMVNQIADMRMKMQRNCNSSNLKRGVGGTVDIEFIVQMLQLKYAAEHPQVLVPGTIAAMDELLKLKVIDREQGVFLIKSYQYLRGVEARLRLMNTTARHDMPDGMDLARLAHLLRIPADQLAQQVGDFRRRNREIFGAIFEEHSESL